MKINLMMFIFCGPLIFLRSSSSVLAVSEKNKEKPKMRKSVEKTRKCHREWVAQFYMEIRETIMFIFYAGEKERINNK